MLLESDRLRIASEEVRRRADYLQQIIKHSERYERLSVNDDFKAYLKDLIGVANIHKEQIEGFRREWVDADSPFKRMRIDNVMLKHEIRREQIEEFVGYPERILREATQAREELATIKEKIKEEKGNG